VLPACLFRTILEAVTHPAATLVAEPWEWLHPHRLDKCIAQAAANASHRL